MLVVAGGGGGWTLAPGPKRQPQARHMSSKLTLFLGPDPLQRLGNFHPWSRQIVFLVRGWGTGSGLLSIQIFFETHTCKGKFLPFNETKYLFIN